jgi:hypothetical protein
LVEVATVEIIIDIDVVMQAASLLRCEIRCTETVRLRSSANIIITVVGRTRLSFFCFVFANYIRVYELIVHSGRTPAARKRWRFGARFEYY